MLFPTDFINNLNVKFTPALRVSLFTAVFPASRPITGRNLTYIRPFLFSSVTKFYCLNKGTYVMFYIYLHLLRLVRSRPRQKLIYSKPLGLLSFFISQSEFGLLGRVLGIFGIWTRSWAEVDGLGTSRKEA